MTTPIQHPFSDDLLNIIADLIEPRMLPQESRNDILYGSIYLALKRADLLGRPPTYMDVIYSTYAFCWWPFKHPGPGNEDMLRSIRQNIFSDAAQGDFNRLDALPNSMLMLSFDALDKLLEQGRVSDFGISDEG